MTYKFKHSEYPNMRKIDWKELKFREPFEEEALFISKLPRSANKHFPVLRGTAITSYGYTEPAWEVFELITSLTGEHHGVPYIYYAVVRINGSDIVTETLCYEKIAKKIKPGDDIIIIKKSDSRAYSYPFI